MSFNILKCKFPFKNQVLYKIKIDIYIFFYFQNLNYKICKGTLKCMYCYHHHFLINLINDKKIIINPIYYTNKIYMN